MRPVNVTRPNDSMMLAPLGLSKFKLQLGAKIAPNEPIVPDIPAILMHWLTNLSLCDPSPVRIVLFKLFSIPTGHQPF
jgi:hypothetical protein